MSDFDTQPPSTDAVPADARQWGLFAHLSALIGLIIPFGNVLGPLIIWQVKKAEMPFVDDQGKEALNFQITVSLALMACALLAWILIGFPLAVLVSLFALVVTIIAGIRANDGVPYRYPLCWRLVK